MITQVRVARPSIMLNGADWFTQLAPYFLNCTYTDNCDGENADDFQLQLADRDRRFISDWRPDPGTFFEAEIICERWFAPNAAPIKLDCGKFWIDSVDFDLPQHTVSIKASSIPTDQKLKGADETRGWEDAPLQDVATQIADENNMKLDWQAITDPFYHRVEQQDESGLCFLKKRATDNKLAIKVHKGSIVVFSEQQMEETAPSFTLVYGEVQGGGGQTYRMTGGQFHLMINDTAKKARNKFSRVETGDTESSEYDTDDEDVSEYGTDTNEDPGQPQGGSSGGGGGTRRRTVKADGLEGDWETDTGDDLPQATLRSKNKDTNNATIEMAIGNPLIAAGQTFILQGVGQFDGKWFIVSAEHTVGPQYDTRLTVRRCLQGY